MAAETMGKTPAGGGPEHFGGQLPVSCPMPLYACGASVGEGNTSRRNVWEEAPLRKADQ